MSKLSDSQLVVLSAACQRPDRCVFPVTPKLKGNAAGNVLKSLLNKKLIKEVRATQDDTVWQHDKNHGKMTLRVTRAAFDALGIDPADAGSDDEAEPAGEDADAEAPDCPARRSESKKRTRASTGATRADTKQAQLIAMLKCPKGATIEEIVNAFGWRPHTVRGAIAGALKKKLGLDVLSDKVDGRGRITASPKADLQSSRRGSRLGGFLAFMLYSETVENSPRHVASDQNRYRPPI